MENKSLIDKSKKSLSKKERMVFPLKNALR